VAIATFVGSTFVGMGASRNGAYFLDLDLGGWNHLVIAEVAELAPSDRVVGGGFCVWAVSADGNREASQTRDYCAAKSAARRAARSGPLGDDKAVASG
jgi:hypothetical protein